ncbi:MAG: sarcosine oxidase subunit gamma family protein [Rhodopseudomonas sp.]|uniref:sarcosine oxidase subunit gamma n=1 Tax=Rhodopseudomonas sp. TaxID=1078 RepID=UPI0039E5F977
MDELAAQPASASFVPPRSASGDGVVITERQNLALATLQTRRGQHAALRARVAARFHVDLPQRPAVGRTQSVSFVGVGPETWLVIAPDGGPSFVRSLKADVAGLGSVSDQSGGHAVFRVGGRAVGATLAKLVPIDLDPATFKVGDAATTVAAHVGVTLWRCPDGLDGEQVFELSVFRSLAGSFLECFWDSAAEFGCRWDAQPPRASTSSSR